MLGELSDLTCGDAWIGEAKRDISRLGTGPKSAGSDLGAQPLPDVMRTDRLGSSFVVSRTPEGEGLLENAASCLAVELSELDLRELLASQDHALFKKRKLAARMRLFELTGRSVPMYRQKLLSPTRGDYIDMMKFYAARYVLSGRHRLLRPLFHAARRLKRAVLRRPRAPAELTVGNELSSEIA
ncbi:MAG: hypothetical protein A2Y77_13125 [Planctomycetes bacterium RBG_13_62_9]|nr:MAG: hypothetical protein A2Y77_13125 [Planctomycetes bacterium RBG_13_62_9]